MIDWLILNLGGPGLLLVAVADSSFLTIPEGNDLLIVLMSAGRSWGVMAYFVAMTTIGSVIGCVLLYSVGRKGGAPLLRRRVSEATMLRVERLLERYGILTLFIPSILPPPCPFKIFVLTAGVFRVRMGAFVAVIAIGRLLRYSMWGVLAVLYGQAALDFMKRNLPAVGIGFLVVMAALVAVIVVMHLRRQGSSAN